MNKLNTVLLVVVLFLLLVPDGAVSMPAPVNTGAMEMYFAFAAADEGDGGGAQDCQCGGDGDVGDGNIKVPCPCVKNGGVCKCPKDEGAAPIDVEEPVPANWTYAIVLTNPSWCVYCRAFDKNVVSQLGPTWKKATKEGGYVHIITVDENSPLLAKYGNEALFRTQGGTTEVAFPSVLLVRNGKVVKRFIGFDNLPKTPSDFTREFISVK